MPSPRARRFQAFALAVSGLLTFAGAMHGEDFQGAGHRLPYEEGVIQYNTQTPSDPVALLQKALDGGTASLRWDAKLGYLPSVLEALHVPASSQTLVFSKTSFQRRAISPKTPRALYFNDDVYIGFIPGAPKMEVSAVDPKLGGIFYTLEQSQDEKPTFSRTTDCLSCHGADRSLGVPGHIMRSIGTDEQGEILSQTEISPIDHCTPMADRWAGWYVTGTHGSQTHRGNLIGEAALARQSVEPNYLGNLTDLSRFFDTRNYLRPGSDIVALMVLEHQKQMHNYITRLDFETRLMMETYGHIRYLRSQVNAFLRCLLFTEETPLTAAIAGDPAFVKDFEAAGPRDHLGRSLRDLDLHTRMFRYPCSFLIYSPAFDQLPEVMRDHLLQRLYVILQGQDSDPQFTSLSAESRGDILQILRETKPGLPAYWQEAG